MSSELSTWGSKRAFDRLLNHKKKIKQSIESSESSCLISFCAFEMIRFLSTLICVTATTLLQVAARYLRMMEINCIYISHAVQALHVSKTIRNMRFVPENQLCRSLPHALLNGFSLFVCLRWLIDVFVSLCIVQLSITAFMLSMFGFLSHLFFLFRFPKSGRFWLSLISDCSNLVVPYGFVSFSDGGCSFEYCCKQTASNHTWCCLSSISAAKCCWSFFALKWKASVVRRQCCRLDVDAYDVVLITKRSSSWWFYDRWLFSPD